MRMRHFAKRSSSFDFNFNIDCVRNSWPTSLCLQLNTEHFSLSIFVNLWKFLGYFGDMKSRHCGISILGTLHATRIGEEKIVSCHLNLNSNYKSKKVWKVKQSSTIQKILAQLLISLNLFPFHMLLSQFSLSRG